MYTSSIASTPLLFTSQLPHRFIIVPCTPLPLTLLHSLARALVDHLGCAALHETFAVALSQLWRIQQQQQQQQQQ
jgi:hypothetical protein